jgi:hypothetical protein
MLLLLPTIRYAVSQGSRFSPRSAQWPPHNGFKRIKWNNLHIVLPKRSHVPRELTSSIAPARAALPRQGGTHMLLQAAALASLRQRNWKPSVHIRCRITAKRRAGATIAFLPPRRRASCMSIASPVSLLMAPIGHGMTVGGIYKAWSDGESEGERQFVARSTNP